MGECVICDLDMMGVPSKLLNSKTTQRSDAIFIIQINLEKKN
jgi:hypothetical protein